ncbi:methyl-accepting chemotaxis protein [Bacillus paralicheniformis]|uniref:methyl-accepting chemotaxis protein n=1 Tax=Bacillus TaxID=1386 RepID=UPI0003FA11A6|nr:MULTISPECIES: methyl-accepting chemotaxis protein [Bacillus]MCD2368256.1 methyl-accepting chemotaxis protein [Bacillus sp. BS3(2021)]MCJ8229649.1 methyl-accepting chemotaxis protein [Bacillus paralicheniformis]MCY8180743.1 methyl-accepting chemotaxis protein [Bacillus paralicheniformis]MEC4202740.1 methyl-accepting chemotaxis protein [Bacillus sp. AAVF1]PAC95458.1 methyl-accepting chemotaxis protein [Bacillus paralicheniformis]
MKTLKKKLTEHISVKIMIGVALVLLITIASFSAVFTYISKDLSEQLRQQFQNRLYTDIHLAENQIKRLDGNPLEIDSADNPLYKQTKMAVDSLKKKNNLENIYILSNEGGKERILVLSDTSDDFGTDYSFSPEMKEALTTNKETVSDVYEDEYGIHQSIFQPLENSSGEKVGILGIDLDASVIPATAAKAKWYTIAIAAFVLLLGMAMAYFLGSFIAKPIRQLMKASEKIADGDLSADISVKSRDEAGKLAESFKRMSENLQQLIGQISASSEEVSKTSLQLKNVSAESSESAAQVAESMNSMSEGINEVVSSVSDCHTSAAEIDHQLTHVTEEVNEMKNVAEGVSKDSKTGQELVEETLRQTQTIKNVMEESKQAAAEMQNHTEEIEKVIGMISSIAEQTNLLALNASIEAARVGEEGQGFAVVAGEVRKLSERSADAALSVSQLVAGTQESSRLVMERIQEGNAAVDKGQILINGTYENFSGIFKGISQFAKRTDQLLQSLLKVEKSYQNISAAMEQISAVTEEQAAGSEEVAAAAEQQSAGMQEIASAIQQLSALSEELNQAASKFKLAAE